jgi:MATE family multidrug resistance protein
MGIVSAVSPLASQAFGARDPRMVRRALRVGLWAAALLGLPLSFTQFYGEEMLLALGQTPEAARLAAGYLHGLAWSLVPAWWFIALRGFMQSVNRPEPGLWITLAAIAANTALAYALIYGEFGLPRLEMFGAGLATTIVDTGMCVACVWVCYACRPFRKYRVLGRFWVMDWRLLARLVVTGAPICGTMLLEFGVFAAAALPMGWLGTTELAAHQIAVTTASSCSWCRSGSPWRRRSASAAGRRNAAGTRTAGIAAIMPAAAFMAGMTVAVIAARDTIPLLFPGLGTDAADPTRHLAALLLVVGCTFGLNDTRMPLLFSAVCFWAIGFTACCLMGFTVNLGRLGSGSACQSGLRPTRHSWSGASWH